MLTHGTDWKLVVSFTLLLLYPFGRNHTTHCIRGCVVYRSSLDCLVNEVKLKLIIYLYNVDRIQGDQKVCVHLMITIQKVTTNVKSVPPPVSRHLL
jgi:hypothetical protein